MKIIRNKQKLFVIVKHSPFNAYTKNENSMKQTEIICNHKTLTFE